jgi:hypothetical protein
MLHQRRNRKIALAFMSAINSRAVQRGRLLERIAQQRAVLSADLAPIILALEAADQVIQGAEKTRRWISDNPVIAGAGLIALLIWRPKGLVKLAKNGAISWRALRLVRRLLS